MRNSYRLYFIFCLILFISNSANADQNDPLYQFQCLPEINTLKISFLNYTPVEKIEKNEGILLKKYNVFSTWPLIKWKESKDLPGECCKIPAKDPLKFECTFKNSDNSETLYKVEIFGKPLRGSVTGRCGMTDTIILNLYIQDEIVIESVPFQIDCGDEKIYSLSISNNDVEVLYNDKQKSFPGYELPITSKDIWPQN